MNSQASQDDKIHSIAPINYQGTRDEAKQKILKIIKGMPRTKIVKEAEDYIHVTFTTKIMRYVDDVQFYFDDTNKVIHFRSASRVGYSDLGLNRQRMEEIRKLFF